MSSIIKVDTIQDQDGNNIINENANTITIGKAGDSVNVTPGAIKDNSGNVIISKSGSAVTIGASGDTVSVASGAEFVGGGIQWQSSIKTSDFTAVAGEGYWINTTSAAVTVTLPASASVGDRIILTDYARKWGTNAVTINTNSLNFQGFTSPNPVYNTDGQSVDIVYSGATKGWIPNSDDDVTFETSQAYDVEYLLVAGGGSGGAGDAAGAGAGGHLTNFGGTAVGMEPGEVYTVTVGGGGAAIGSPGVKLQGSDGDDSTVSGSGVSLTAIGGGGGAAQIDPSENRNGRDGGSGGGACLPSGTAGSGTVSQGNDGGVSRGGGGGAGAAGGTPNGGNGLANSITGSSVTRAGGGGAFVPPGGSPGSGGSGGGTNGAPSPSPRSSASPANTGGGTGGGDNGGSGTAGSGVVILRMATSDYSGTTSGSPTVTTDGTDTILTFNASGSYTA
jgi:hypothetical protein